MNFCGIWIVLSSAEKCKYPFIDSKENSMISRNPVKVLVLDGHSSAALAFVRSLGRAGFWLAVGYSKGSFAPAALSRYCKLRFEYSNPTNGATSFSDSVLKFVRQNGIDVVMPMTDATIWPLSSEREQFREDTLLALASYNAIEIATDKYRTINLAEEFGIPVPETILVRSIEDLKLTSTWPLPIVVKDRSSARWIDNKAMLASTSYTYSQEELNKIVGKRLSEIGDVLLQKFVAGIGIGFSCFSSNGDIYIPFQWERIREKDPRGSGSSARKSVRLEAQVIEFAEKLITEIGFQGILMFEFKKEKQNGRLTLIEINGRPWGSIQLAIHCGIDYPLHFINWHLEGKCPPKQIDYKKGITCKWLTADLVHLENLWEGKPIGWPLDYPSFWLSLLKIGIPWYPGLRYDDLSFDDPKPGVAELMKWLGSHIRKDAN